MKQHWLIISVTTISIFLILVVLLTAILVNPAALFYLPVIGIWQRWGVVEQNKINRKLEKWNKSLKQRF